MRKFANIIFGIIQIVLSIYWIYEMASLFYQYHYTDILFAYMFSDWVLFSNIGLSLINLYFGIKLARSKTSIKRSYLTMLGLFIIGVVINFLTLG